MKPAVDVVYRDLDASDALNSIIHKKFAKLSRYSDQITHSRVVLDTPHCHKHKGKQYRASIELSVKGSPVTITHDDDSIHLAVRDAFSIAERKLKNITGKRVAGRHKSGTGAVATDLSAPEQDAGLDEEYLEH
jgi:ribosomal subunit interface protein